MTEGKESVTHLIEIRDGMEMRMNYTLNYDGNDDDQREERERMNKIDRYSSLSRLER